MEREKENPSQLNRIFTCGHTQIHHIYCTSLQKIRKVKVSHNLNKSASVYSEMAFRCSDFQFKTPKKCTKVFVWTLCEDIIVPLIVKIGRRG